MDEQLMQSDEVLAHKLANGDDSAKYVSITEAAQINGVTRQAIYVAIKQNKLKAVKETTRWKIHLKDLEEYRANKYSRAKSTFDGELLFDNQQGYYSVNQTAKMLGVPAQKIYYATRIGALKAVRKGSAWVIHLDDIKGYRDTYLAQQQNASDYAM
ncbi:MAG: helix-turn-helix domain-containing protein [Simkaniaceae bacterium]|nr:helix-turn-helix domain-containing protein [Simkaniaceae bacterium]